MHLFIYLVNIFHSLHHEYDAFVFISSCSRPCLIKATSKTSIFRLQSKLTMATNLTVRLNGSFIRSPSHFKATRYLDNTAFKEMKMAAVTLKISFNERLRKSLGIFKAVCQVQDLRQAPIYGKVRIGQPFLIP